MRKVWILFIFIVLLKVLLVSFVLAPTAYSDEYTYIKTARSFFNSGTFYNEGLPMWVHPPLYPLVISISYLFQDMTVVYFVVKVIGVLLSSLVIFPVYLLAKEFLSSNKSLLVSFLVSVIPSYFVISSYVLSENLFYPLFLFSIYYIYKSFSENHYKYNILAGLFAGLASLTKTSGLMLLFLIIILSFVYLIKRDHFVVYRKIISILLFLFIYCLWLMRNFLLFGFENIVLGRDIVREASFSSGIFSLNFVGWILFYIGYLVLALGIMFFLSSLFIYKDIFKNRNLFLYFLILFVVTTLTILIAANHNLGNIESEGVSWLTGRPIGRYIDFILPLFFISGFIGLNKKDCPLLSFIITFMFLVISSLLVFYQLFPVNNLSLTWLGILKHVLMSFTDFAVPLLVIFIVLLFFLMLHVKRLSFKFIYFIFLIFFISSSVAAYGVLYYNSSVVWYSNKHTQLGLWFNNYDKDVSNVLFDERYEGKILKGDVVDLETGETGIYQQGNFIISGELMGYSSIMGFWMNDNLFFGDIDDIGDVDYIITKDKLDLDLIKRVEDIYVYRNV